jgi:hypothetical protein
MSGRRTTMIARCAAVVLVTILFARSPVLAQTFGAAPGAALRVSIGEAVDGRQGPMLTGHVYNDTPNIVVRVRLHVNVLDASGQVLGEGDGAVPVEIPAYGRQRFEVPVRARGARYDVTITNAEALDRKGM